MTHPGLLPGPWLPLLSEQDPQRDVSVSPQVSPEMQCDVLRRLFQTDPDVIEYLLRRKFPDLP